MDSLNLNGLLGNLDPNNNSNMDINSLVDMEQFNSIIKNANDYVKCGPECQKKTKVGRLKKKYEDLMNKEENYDKQLADAKRDYYRAAFGDAAFNTEVRKDVENAADETVGKIKKEFGEVLINVESALGNLEKGKINKQLVKELREKLEKENRGMEKHIERDENKMSINQRLAEYQSEDFALNDDVNNIFNYLLIAAFVVYVCIFIYFSLGYSRFNIFTLIILGLLVFRVYIIVILKLLYKNIFG